jgi:lysophospholipase L1-like esterase
MRREPLTTPANSLFLLTSTLLTAANATVEIDPGVERRLHRGEEGAGQGYNHPMLKHLASTAAKLVAASLCAIVAVAGSHAADAGWVASWGSSPLEGKIVIPGVPPEKIPPSPILKGTVRYRLPLSLGGTRLILRISNEPNKESLRVGAVTVGIADAGVEVRAATIRKVTFGGQSKLTIPAGAPVLSDPVDLSTNSTDALIVSIYLPDDTECPLGQRGMRAVILDGRDATRAPILKGGTATAARTLVSAILVAGGPEAKTVVAIGDSITDGSITNTPDVRGWPGYLALRLSRAAGPTRFAVANEGIGGNRVLSDLIGLSALARFDRDVLSLPNVTHLILLEGINDIGFPNLPDVPNPGPPIEASSLIAAYRQMIVRAHLHGVKVIGGTILPFQGAMYYSEAGDQTRQTVNEWIRSGGEFDAVVDFDSALRDPAEPKKLAAAYDSGDHLHPSDAGYKAMSVAFDLNVFCQICDAGRRPSTP